MLNESHLFLVLSGFVAGLVYYANFYLSHLSYLAFPTLQVCICSLFFCTHLYLSHLSHLAFPTLQVCICSLCFSVPTFISHTSPTGLSNTSGVYLQSLFFCTPSISHTSPTGLSNTSGVYLKSLFFCTFISHASPTGLSNTSGVYLKSIFLYPPLFLMPHLLAFPTLQVCLCNLFFCTHLYLSCLTYWPFQHFRCVSAICFSVPTFISHTSPTGLSNTSGVYLQSLFFCTHLYLSCLTYWPFQHFRCVLCWCSAKWFLYLQLVLHAISSITFSVNDGDLAWLVQVDHEWEGSCSPWIWLQCTIVA